MPIKNIGSFLVTSTNEKELALLEKEIFSYHSYYFETENLQPLIFDIGAHVGVATLYFKQLYPQSTIIALEPHPVSYKLLLENIEANLITDVIALNQALSHQAGSQTFFVDPEEEWLTTASFTKGAWTQDQPTKAIQTSTVTLASLIERFATTEVAKKRMIDLVKMDIEGAEHLVLPQAGEELFQIKELLLEYHPSSKNGLEKIAQRLAKFGLLPEEKISTSPKKLRQLQLLRFLRK